MVRSWRDVRVLPRTLRFVARFSTVVLQIEQAEIELTFWRPRYRSCFLEDRRVEYVLRFHQWPQATSSHHWLHATWHRSPLQSCLCWSPASLLVGKPSYVAVNHSHSLNCRINCRRINALFSSARHTTAVLFLPPEFQLIRSPAFQQWPSSSAPALPPPSLPA